ncbi:hypothetical protein OQA88_2507 [Cercophora sp. LCS_1]
MSREPSSRGTPPTPRQPSEFDNFNLDSYGIGCTHHVTTPASYLDDGQCCGPVVTFSSAKLCPQPNSLPHFRSQSHDGPSEHNPSSGSDDPTGNSQDLGDAPQGTDDSSMSSERKSSQSETAYPQEDEGDGISDDDLLFDFVKCHLSEEAARSFCDSVKGKLVYVPREEPDAVGDLTALTLLEGLYKNIRIGDFRAPVRSVASSSERGGSTTTGDPSGAPSGRRGKNPAPVPQKPDRSGDRAPGDEPGEAAGKAVPRAATSTAGYRNLRCVYNAAFPTYYCVRVGKKYQPCAGPGYTRMQYLKEHLKNTHRAASSFKCHNCQDNFPTDADLRRHSSDVDCFARCAECNEEFSSKKARSEHIASNHLGASHHPHMRDMDGETQQKLKASLKSFTDSLRRSDEGQDAARDRWISANIDEFKIGRDPKINPRLELGQWYIMFAVLFPGTQVPEHPFYEDFEMGTEVVIEQILFVYDNAVRASLSERDSSENGPPPPTDPERSREFFRHILSSALNIAAHTRLSPGAWGQLTAPQSSSTNASGGTSFSSFDEIGHIDFIPAVPQYMTPMPGHHFGSTAGFAVPQPVTHGGYLPSGSLATGLGYGFVQLPPQPQGSPGQAQPPQLMAPPRAAQQQQQVIQGTGAMQLTNAFGTLDNGETGSGEGSWPTNWDNTFDSV